MSQIIEVCHDCKDLIKKIIKSPGYKPLGNPKACEKCKQKTVEKSYHKICNNCAIKEHICAKCIQSIKDDECIPSPITSDKDHQKFKKEIDKLIKTLPERKRNKFLRFMRRGKKVKTKVILPSSTAQNMALGDIPEDAINQTISKDVIINAHAKESKSNTILDSSDSNDDYYSNNSITAASVSHQKKFVVRRIPHSKETLLRKIEELKTLEEVDETETSETESEFE